MSNYFYQFLEPVSKELARTLKELEGAIYSSPRSMLTHSRTMMEALLEKVMVHENMPNEPYLTIMERIQDLDDNGLLTEEVKDALHEVRKLGNIASHHVRQFRYSESLITWERIYIIVKWFVEVYGSYKIEVPEYVDPKMKADSSYDLEEMNIRFKKIEDLLKESISNEQPKEREVVNVTKSEVAATNTETLSKTEKEKQTYISIDEEPGLTSVRTITYKDEAIGVPQFIRDAFLLPQRFPKSETFLIRLNREQEARLMSELPASLDNLHERVTRYNESHTENFFNELKQFIDEEIRRRELMETRPGELFLFYDSDEIVVTEELGKEAINKDNFTGAPGLIDQLNADGMFTVRDLPKELVIIGKYQGVGKGRVDNFFKQLKELQKRKIKELTF